MYIETRVKLMLGPGERKKDFWIRMYRLKTAINSINEMCELISRGDIYPDKSTAAVVHGWNWRTKI